MRRTRRRIRAGHDHLHQLHLERRERREPPDDRRRVRGREPRHHRRGHHAPVRRLRHRDPDRPRGRHGERRVRHRVLELRPVPGERRPRADRGREPGRVQAVPAGGLRHRRDPVRPPELVLGRRPVLQQGPVRRGWSRLPGQRLDLGRREGCRRGADRQGRRRVGRPPAGELLRVLQGARAERRSVPGRRRQERRVQHARRASRPRTGWSTRAAP